jgi:hypothetical protein
VRCVCYPWRKFWKRVFLSRQFDSDILRIRLIVLCSGAGLLWTTSFFESLFRHAVEVRRRSCRGFCLCSTDDTLVPQVGLSNTRSQYSRSQSAPIGWPRWRRRERLCSFRQVSASGWGHTAPFRTDRPPAAGRSKALAVGDWRRGVKKPHQYKINRWCAHRQDPPCRGTGV